MILEPVCTCAVPGINGCAKHTWPQPADETLELARHIVDGHAFTDQDAIAVATALLQREDGGREQS